MADKSMLWALGGGIFLLGIGMVQSNNPSKKLSFIPGLDDKLRTIKKLPTSGPDDPDVRKTKVASRRGKEISKLQVDQQPLFEFFRTSDLINLPKEIPNLKYSGEYANDISYEERKDEYGNTYVAALEPIQYIPEGQEVVHIPGSRVSDKAMKYHKNFEVEKPEGTYLIDVRASTNTDKPGTMMMTLHVHPRGWHKPIRFDRYYKKQVTLPETEQRVDELVRIIKGLSNVPFAKDEQLDDLYKQQKDAENRFKLKEITADQLYVEIQAIRADIDRVKGTSQHTVPEFQRQQAKESLQSSRAGRLPLEHEITTKQVETVSVTIMRQDGTQEDWTIVDPRNVDISRRQISNESPMGKALTTENRWGDMPGVGQIVEYTRPDGKMESFRVMALKKHKVEEKLPGRSKSEVVEVKRTPISDPCPKCGGPTTIRYASKDGAPWRVCNKYPISCSWKQAAGSDVDPNKITPLPRTKIVPLPKESGKKSYAQAAFEKSIVTAIQPKKDEEGDLIPPLAVAEADKRNCELCQKPMLIIQSGYDKKYYYACPDYDPDKHPSVEEYR